MVDQKSNFLEPSSQNYKQNSEDTDIPDGFREKVWQLIGDEYTDAQKEQLVWEINVLSNLIIDWYLIDEQKNI